MDYLVYGRATVEAADQDTPELDEAHWAYMDAFADRMTARGPCLSADRSSWTGSLHVVDLDSGTAAHAFAVNDPYHRAGLFQDHLIRRFDNLLGRTMWDVTAQAGDVPFLIIADMGDPLTVGPASPAPPRPSSVARLVLWGGLRPVEDDRDTAVRPTGMALAVLAPHEAAAHALIDAEPALLAGCTRWQIRAWEFGGRR
jgi:uncharacterized protein